MLANLSDVRTARKLHLRAARILGTDLAGLELAVEALENASDQATGSRSTPKTQEVTKGG